jgi:uncharacterized protein (DUF4415 family)
MAEEFSELFSRVRGFDWNPKKRETNLRDHKIDFEDLKGISTDTLLFVDRIDMVKSGTKSSAMSTAAKSPSRSQSAATFVGSSRHGARAKTKDENFIRASRDSARPGKTDWAAVDALTNKEIEDAVRRDPDAVPPDFDWSKAVLVIPPKKKAISIRVDEDVLDYFKKEGAGYQRRINAVLRSYMQQKRKKRA